LENLVIIFARSGYNPAMFKTIITVTLNPAIDRAIEVSQLEIGSHAQCRTVSRIAGGKGVNVSRVLADMGVASVATGFLGSENRSVFDSVFAQGLIEDSFVDVNGLTRENLTLVNPAVGAEMHLRDEGLAVGKGDIDELASRLKCRINPQCLVIFCGSLPPGVGCREMSKLLDISLAGGAMVAVDASGKALQAAGGKKLWLLKPNAIELSELVGREFSDDAELLDAARSLTDDVENILLSCGGDGAYLVRAEGVLQCLPGMAVDVVNTVGCGDVLLGAFVGSLYRGGDYRDAIMHAVACASASAANTQTAKFQQELADKIFNGLFIKKL